jgi:DNA polymerase (family X)
MNAGQAAAVLAEIGVLLEVVGGNPFRAKAFAAAARSLEGSAADLGALAREGALTSLPGVGEGIAGVLDELVRTGVSSLHEGLRADTPPGLYDLMRVKGLGSKRIRTLYAQAGIDDLEKLEAAAASGRLAALPGFGAKTAAAVLESVAFARAARGRRRYHEAVEIAARLLEWLEARPEVVEASSAGGLRRRLEVVDSIDLVAASRTPAGVLEAFRAAYGGTRQDVEDGGRVEARFADGMGVRLTCVTPPRVAATLVHETGSEAHLRDLAAHAEASGLAYGPDGVRRDGRRVRTKDEAALYRALGLAWIPPELREGWGEVAAAADGALPELVTVDDLRGVFHCHTTYSDGRASVAEMAEGARARGWAYLGIADHSQAAGYAGGLSPSRVRAQHREVDSWNRDADGAGERRFRIFKGIESDVLADGRLDYDDALLARFDYVVGSVHSGMRMTEEEMTARVLRAVRNPRLTILGHATGRLLLRRRGYAVDIDAVLDAAAEHGVVVEINADPHRLDVDWRTARAAARRGVMIAINPDAHSVGALGVVAYGVNVARKAWLTAADVLNTRSLDQVETFLAERKQKGAA